MDTDFIGEWGLLSGFLLLLVALPLHKLIYFGGRGIVGSQSPEIPSDELLHQKLHQEFENGNKRNDQDPFVIAGTIIILISFFIVNLSSMPLKNDRVLILLKTT